MGLSRSTLHYQPVEHAANELLIQRIVALARLRCDTAASARGLNENTRSECAMHYAALLTQLSAGHLGPAVFVSLLLL